MDVRRLGLVAVLALGAAAPPPGAANCSGCHGSGNLPINGMDVGQLEASMTAYQSGELALTSMGRLMKGLTVQDIHAIAAWVSAQR